MKHNLLYNLINIFFNLIISKPQNIKTYFLHYQIPVGIVFFFEQMYWPIDFDNEFMPGTIKVGNVKSTSASQVGNKNRELP